MRNGGGAPALIAPQLALRIRPPAPSGLGVHVLNAKSLVAFDSLEFPSLRLGLADPGPVAVGAQGVRAKGPTGGGTFFLGFSHVRSVASHAYVHQAPAIRVVRRSVTTVPASTVGAASDKPRFGYRRLLKVRPLPAEPVAAFSVCPAVMQSAIGTV